MFTVRCTAGVERQTPADKLHHGIADEFVKQRASIIREALRDAGAGPDAELPAVLIENSSRCDTNAVGQQVLPNEEAWLPALMTSVRTET
jgi:hypothetical protein